MPHPPLSDEGSPSDDPVLAEINAPDWFAFSDQMVGIGFLTVARRLPALIGQALRMAWSASPRDALATIVLSVGGGLFKAFGLLATTGVLEALFSAGPTPERVKEALPSLIIVMVAAALRSVLQAGATVARWSPSWGRTGRARRPWQRSCRRSTSPTRVACSGTAST